MHQVDWYRGDLEFCPSSLKPPRSHDRRAGLFRREVKRRIYNESKKLK